MKYRVLLFLLHFFALGISQEMPPPVSVLVDSIALNSSGSSADSLLEVRPFTNNTVDAKSFDSKFRSKYHGPDFDYSTTKPRETLWQKLTKRIRKILESIFGVVDPNKTANYAENILRLFALAIVGLVLYFLIRFLLNKKGSFFFSKKNNKISIQSHDLRENIHEINFPVFIENFEHQKDYRSAVRYHFLFALKKLADRKLIYWNPEKTNKDYLAELKSTPSKESFEELIFIFDYVWYGEFEVDEKTYAHFKTKFLEFKS